MIAKQERNEEEKHSHYLNAYNLAQRAVSKTEEVFHNVCSLFGVNEVWRYIFFLFMEKKSDLVVLFTHSCMIPGSPKWDYLPVMIGIVWI